jgi:hypothetical protein
VIRNLETEKEPYNFANLDTVTKVVETVIINLENR